MEFLLLVSGNKTFHVAVVAAEKAFLGQASPVRVGGGGSSLGVAAVPSWPQCCTWWQAWRSAHRLL